jgi:hypothetical protein
VAPVRLPPNDPLRRTRFEPFFAKDEARGGDDFPDDDMDDEDDELVQDEEDRVNQDE